MIQRRLGLLFIFLATICVLLVSCTFAATSTNEEKQLFTSIVETFNKEGLSLKEVNQTSKMFDFKGSKEKRYSFLEQGSGVFIFYDIKNMEKTKEEIKNFLAEAEFVNLPISNCYQDFCVVVLLEDSNDQEKVESVLEELSQFN